MRNGQTTIVYVSVWEPKDDPSFVSVSIRHDSTVYVTRKTILDYPFIDPFLGTTTDAMFLLVPTESIGPPK